MQTLPSRRWFGALLVIVLLAACDASASETAPTPPTTAAVEPTEAPAVADRPAPEMLTRALRYRELGEYDAAAHDFHAVINTFPDAAEVRQARFYLAESYGLRERWTSAADAMRAFLADGVQDDLSARALFWLARCNEEAGAWAEAAELYEQYQALGTPLEPYARLRQAAQQAALSQTEQAAASYTAVAASEIARGERAGSHEKAAALLRELGRNDEALALYTNLLSLAQEPAYRARILAEGAALAREQNAAEQAREWEHELVATLPGTAEALNTVMALQGDPGANLAPGDAARVHEAHEQWIEAIPLLDAAIANAAGAEALELRRRRALAVRAIGDTPQALAELQAVSTVDPDGETGRQAQLDWVQTRGQNGEIEAAIEGYRQFAQSYPEDQHAPEALDRAAQLLERLEDAEGAAQQRLDLGRRYGSSELAQDALDAAGWYFYRASRPAEAREAWELLANATDGPVAARAAFWAARAARESSSDDAALLQQADEAAPEAYYGVRSAEIRGTLAASTAPLTMTTSAKEWQEAEAWIAKWSNVPEPQIDAQGYPAEQANTGPLARAIALADVGLFDDAIAEWNEARDRWKDQPQKLYITARLASAHNMPYIGLKAAEDLLVLAPKDAPPTPVALCRLVFPTPYAEVVTAQAKQFGLDARALFALLRQESHFNPRATSWVGARGLAQVMPETAAGIATGLGMDDFTPADLYRPVVSVRFGAHYLSQQINTMNGSLQGALAAYNGGPGNAIRWANGTIVEDPDAFVETIDYEETEAYVKMVYGFYGAYRELYAEP